MLKPFLEIGEIVTTHGVMGEVKIYPWCDDPEVLCELDCLYMAQGSKPRKVKSARVHKNMCLVQFEGVENMDDARKLVGTVVWAARADLELEEGRYFVQDILGCQVRDADTQQVYGTIVNIAYPAANDVYTIRNDAGEEFLFPAVEEFLVELNPEEEFVLVRPIPGMFSDQRSGDE